MAQQPKTKARVAVLEDVETIIDAVEDGQSLRAICRELGIHAGTASRLLRSNPQLDAQYARAKRERAEVFFENVVTTGQAALAGKVKADAARVAIDAFKWAAGKMDPERYSDRQTVSVSGNLTHTVAGERQALLDAIKAASDDF